jgi:hypothetical protein
MIGDVVREILDLQRAPMEELRRRYEEIFGDLPTERGRKAIVARLAHEVQRKAREAGQGDAIRKRARRRQPRPQPHAPKRRRKPGEPRIGTVIVRRWRDVELKLHVHENGYEVDGVMHRSLSAAARAVTGSRWDGRLFWGLKARSRRKKKAKP